MSLKHFKTVALVGNPNSGKTTVFNAFTRLRQKVGNYPGVTVEKKMGDLVLAEDRIVRVIDLPGTYSLSAKSADARIARDVLMGLEPGVEKPDLVVCVLDAGSLQRNLYLWSQLQELRVPVVVALNMTDELEASGWSIDQDKLSQMLGVPVVPMVAVKGQGVDQLKEVIAGDVPACPLRQWTLDASSEQRLQKLASRLSEQQSIGLEQAQAMILSDSQHDLALHTEAIQKRYQWIQTVADAVLSKQRDVPEKSKRTEALDNVLTHRFWGLGIFLGLMGFMFYLIHYTAAYPMDLIDASFGWLSEFASAHLPEGDFRSLITDGIIAGVGGVVIFLPQILILYFFIGLLQDTGYMARAAFMMDRLMSKVGLHGKSFIPMLSSFACAIPGIMAARTIESPKDRLVTIMVAPLMSCAARLPVYSIMITVLMPQSSAGQKALVMLGLYILGIVAAAAVAFLFKSTFLKREKSTFLLEMPPYRRPSMSYVFLHMSERAKLFLKRAGTIILSLSIVLWVLMTYPKHDDLPADMAIAQSYAGQMGHAIEPLIKPLGFDWRIGIGLVGSFAAREVFVSTMSIVFNLGEEGEDDALREVFASATWPDGRPLFSPLVCLSVMMFFVFALQCISTVAIVARETNGYRWPLIQLVLMSALAYCASLLLFQLGRALGFS